MTVTVRRLDATLGAEVTGIDLAALGASEWRLVEKAVDDHGVVVFRRQYLTDDAHVALATRFGDTQVVLDRAQDSVHSEIARLTNLDADGNVVADEEHTAYLFYKGNKYWHSDASFRPSPAKVSLLASLVTPSSGGETEFADMRAAYDALPDERRAFLADKIAVHSFAYSQSLATGGRDVLSGEERRALPPVEHPVVTVHPATGRPSLFVGRHASHVVGVDEDEGRALLEELTEWACQAPRVYRHEWTEGDLVIWDNRCTLHRGRPWDFSEARVMHRVIVSGEPPAGLDAQNATTGAQL